ncbi:MAG: sulfurtransferase [Flavobacteriaceae bacterium]|nr:MAG: sulfurtransferase [Flavobacteriaceae bacterium]
MNLEEILQNPKTTFIDVREELELINDGAIASALHIPLGEIPEHIEAIEAMEKPVVIFCRSGNRSGKAIEFLEAQGIEGLYNGGGYLDLVDILES